MDAMHLPENVPTGTSRRKCDVVGVILPVVVRMADDSGSGLSLRSKIAKTSV